jgi:predicted secreted Zn-dependent protease
MESADLQFGVAIAYIEVPFEVPRIQQNLKVKFDFPAWRARPRAHPDISRVSDIRLAKQNYFPYHLSEYMD